MDRASRDVEKTSVLKGSLKDISLVDLIQVLSMGRQYMAVELEASGGDIVGALQIKSGMLLDARTGREQGKDAFFVLLGDESAKSFTAFRLAGSLKGVTPLGPIDRLVMESVDEEEPEHEEPAPAPWFPAGVTALPEARPIREERLPEPPPVPLRPVERAAEQPQTLQPSVSQASRGRANGRIIGISSPKGGVGKTTLTLNLGVALAERDLRVILIDTDPLGGLGDSLTHRVRESPGVYEILSKQETVSSSLIQTRIKSLSILSAGQWPISDDGDNWRFSDKSWATLFDDVAARSDIILVDTAAGLHGVTTSVLRHCDDVLGVLQAEALGARSFKGLLRFLEQFSVQGRPRLGGIVINMFQYQDGVSQPVIHDVLKGLPANIVMHPVIPRDPLLLEASSYGVPVAMLGDDQSPSNLTAIFDSLAADLSMRLGVGQKTKRKAISLVD